MKFHINPLSDAGRVTEDAERAGGVPINVDENIAIDAVVAFAIDGEGSIGFLRVDWFGVAVASDSRGKVIGGIKRPRIAGLS